MDTKEAIKVLNCMQAHFCNNQKSMNNIKEIIELLQRGEKYEAIVREIEDIMNKNLFPYDRLDLIRDILKDVKQKYFPEPSKDFTGKVMEKIKEEGL